MTFRKFEIQFCEYNYRKMPDIQFLLMQTSYGNHHWTPPKGMHLMTNYIHLHRYIIPVVLLFWVNYTFWVKLHLWAGSFKP